METVVIPSHKKPGSHINVKVEFSEVIKEYIEGKYGFKVHTAYIAEVKRNSGLPIYDDANALEELKQPRKHSTSEKVEAIKAALKHCNIYRRIIFEM